MAEYSEKNEFESGNDNVVFRKILSIKDKRFIKLSKAVFNVDHFLYAYVTRHPGWGAKSKADISYELKILLSIWDKDKEQQKEISITFQEEQEAACEFDNLKECLLKYGKEK